MHISRKMRAQRPLAYVHKHSFMFTLCLTTWGYAITIYSSTVWP